MMTLLRKQFGDPLVRFRHEIVDNYQVSRFRIERRYIGKTLDKFYVRMYRREREIQRLPFTVTPRDLFGR